MMVPPLLHHGRNVEGCRRLGLLEELTACLEDPRQAGKVDHSLRELVAQRVFSTACGCSDANDSARLAKDLIHKLLLDRIPVEGNQRCRVSAGARLGPHEK